MSRYKLIGGPCDGGFTVEPGATIADATIVQPCGMHLQYLYVWDPEVKAWIFVGPVDSSSCGVK